MNRIGGLLLISLVTLGMVGVIFARLRRMERMMLQRTDGVYSRLIGMENRQMAQWEDVISKIRDQRTVIASLDVLLDKMRMDLHAISTTATAATAMKLDGLLKELDTNSEALKAAVVENTESAPGIHGESFVGSADTQAPGTTPITGSGNNVAGEAATMVGNDSVPNSENEREGYRNDIL